MSTSARSIQAQAAADPALAALLRGETLGYDEDEITELFLRAGRVRGISCSEHALLRSAERFGLRPGLSTPTAKFELAEQVRANLLAGRFARHEPRWTRKSPWRRNRQRRQGMYWCWDVRRSRCFLLALDGSWQIVTCLRRRCWAAPLSLLACLARTELSRVIRLDADGREGLLRVGAFMAEIVEGRRPRYGAFLSAYLAQRLDLLVLDFAGAEALDERELGALLIIANRRLDTHGQIVVLNREPLPEVLLGLLAARYGLRPLDGAPELPGQTLRLWRPRAAANEARRARKRARLADCAEAII